MNKKGWGGIFLGISLVIFITIGIIIELRTQKQNTPICEEKYKQYELMNCVSNLDSIESCHPFNMSFIKVEKHIFSSDTLICYNGEIIRI